jgi:hypothetical protein
MRNEEVLGRVKEERNLIHAIKKRNADWRSHIFGRICLLKQVIEEEIEGRIEVK